MLNVQRWLINNGLSLDKSLEKLNSELSIRSCIHNDGRLILNYSQIDSPKTNEIVRECRGLTLNSDNWNLVARAFPRFFNLGENLDEQKNFVWEGAIATEKYDGSLILVYWWNNEWHLNTRGSFGHGLVNNTPYTWRQLFDMAMPDDWRNRLYNKRYTYVFELCSRYNKVVRDYEKPRTYLLTIFEGVVELPYVDTMFAQENLFKVPSRPMEFSSAQEVKDYIQYKSEYDPTYEGVVLRDVNDMRIKVKSAKYVELHRLANNGAIASVKSIVPFVLSGETDEVLAYFPELADFIEKVQIQVDDLLTEVSSIWDSVKTISDKKSLALRIKGYRLSWVFFIAFDTSLLPVDIIRSNPDRVIKILEQR